MPSLLDRTQGYAAFAVRRALGKDMWSEIQALRRRVDELERALALDLRTYGGLTINDFGTWVGLDHRKRHHLKSSDGSITLTRLEGLPYAVDLAVDADVMCDAIIDCVLARILASPDFMTRVCNFCDTGDPPDPWPGGG